MNNQLLQCANSLIMAPNAHAVKNIKNNNYLIPRIQIQSRFYPGAGIMIPNSLKQCTLTHLITHSAKKRAESNFRSFNE